MLRFVLAVQLIVSWFLVGGSSQAADANALSAAMEAITADDLKNYVTTLADDSFEGRDNGSRGGRAAGNYLAGKLQEYALRGGGTQGYTQPFGSSSRNIIGLLEGSDPALRDEYVLVSAHYDHVGFGTRSNSNGPVGYIHNGADDNASGVAGVLEVIDGFKKLPQPPRRSILFAFWDGEEDGLLGSKHWVAHPTVPLNKIAAVFNVDMIGRLRNDRVIVYGGRTSYGWRQLLARQNEPMNLMLDFNWLMAADSDHHPFFIAGLPVVMLHTGLHDDYHKPSDDAERVNAEGMQLVSRLMFRAAAEVADVDARPKFRGTARQESPSTRETKERPLAPLTGRLGLRWNPELARQGTIEVASVTPGGAAAKAGLRAGDRLTQWAGQPIDSEATLRRLVLATEGAVPVIVQRRGSDQPIELSVEPTGAPVRLGIAWQVDDAEPGAVTLSRVVPGSSAAAAGLSVLDRVYEVSGQPFSGSDAFRALMLSTPSPMELLVESRGRLRRVEVERLEPVTSATVANDSD